MKIEKEKDEKNLKASELLGYWVNEPIILIGRCEITYIYTSINTTYISTKFVQVTEAENNEDTNEERTSWNETELLFISINV